MLIYHKLDFNIRALRMTVQKKKTCVIDVMHLNFDSKSMSLAVILMEHSNVVL